MATMANLPPGAFALEDHNGSDPFVTSAHDAQRQRYAAFDNSQFSLYLNGSPEQAKRALQAHLAETTRRLQDASQLGAALVQQRKELEDKLKEVEKQDGESDIGPELRQRLAELEKEFNEVGRETARAFLPKSRVPSGETDATAGASVYSSEVQHSPSKVIAPSSRKQRNAQTSRINDIALATEISTSLLSQLKELQAVLQEKDEALKAATLDRSQLEIEVEGLSQRVRTLDESESRLKDVNWGLETQVRDFEASTKTAADKENRLNHNLNLAKSEKAQLEREFEELKQLYAKLHDDHISRTKQHDTELTGLRRNVSMGETERGALQRKVDELATQNQELAKAVAYRMRSEEQATGDEVSPDDATEEGDTITPEHSPPPSPSKATPRHGQLESETLKHSLHHAHRMIQQLKNNIHREKTEKIELKRMLQDSRDELESQRNSINGPGSAGKRRKNDKDVFKKPARPDRLGALRTGSHEIVVDDEEWEEQDSSQNTPSRRQRPTENVPGAFPSGFSSAAETRTEGFETANDTSDAFETANERDGTATETDAFQTGAETLDGNSSEDLTETESGPLASNIRAARPMSLAGAGNRKSYESTASTSGDENDMEAKTPIQTQHPRYRLKLKGSGFRRSSARASQENFQDTPPLAKGSPASFVSNSNSNNNTPAQGKSLFAELGDLSGSEDGSVAEGTPSRSSVLSLDSSPEVLRRSVLGRSPLQAVSPLKPIMVESSMMTEPWSPATSEQLVPASPPVSHIGIVTTQETQPVAPVIEKATAPSLHRSSLFTQDTVPKMPEVPTKPHQPLHVSSISTHGTEPVAPIVQRSLPPSLVLSSIEHQTTQPTEPVHEETVRAPMAVSSIFGQATEPLNPPVPIPVVDGSKHTPLQWSSLSTQNTEPMERSMVTSAFEASKPAQLQMSALSAHATEPLVPAQLVAPQLSSHTFQATEPIVPPRAAAPQLSLLTSEATQPVESQRKPLPQMSTFSTQSTTPVEPPQRTPSLLSTVTVQHTEPTEPHILSRPRHRLSGVMVLQDTQPESPTLPAFLPSPSRPMTAHQIPEHTLGFSSILSQATEPQIPSRPVTAHRMAPVPTFSTAQSVQTEENRTDEAEARKLGPSVAGFPWNKGLSDGSTRAPDTSAAARDGRTPLGLIASNAVQSQRSPSPPKMPQTPTADEGTQTMVSAEQIDKLLAARMQRYSGSIAAAGVEKTVSPPSSPRRLSNDPQRTIRRPGSSGSIRSRTASPPPLPADHREVIAAAALKTPQPLAPGPMGPPTMPASAYKKRPQTPTIKTNVVSSPKTGGSTPRARHQVPRGDSIRSGASSPITRRSSISSFTSEIDHRFNIAAMPFAQSGFDPNRTDPRMIQAITQTMIGEYLWKYTRRAGREEMSKDRHRRFFWIHPYTRTLYWSDQDPQTAGKAQLKAKSVAIESVQVVTDDNPYPPGLHRKSLIVKTPGRTVQFTAPTGQRHETWFNALSYLLMRGTEDSEAQQATTEEIETEFNGGMRSASRNTGRSRSSMASYVTRRTSSPHNPTLTQRNYQSQQASTIDNKHASLSGRLSSLSGRFRGSFASRHSGVTQQDAASDEQPNPSPALDSFDQNMLQHTDMSSGMLNVRSCCDGKHDVGHLHHSHTGGRQGHRSLTRASLAGSMSSRSQSRAESYKTESGR